MFSKSHPLIKISSIEAGTKIWILSEVQMPAHMSMFILNVLFVRHHNGKWACKRLSSISFSSRTLPFKKEVHHLPHSSFVCHYTGAHIKTWVFFRLFFHEGYFVSWWEWELLDIKDHSVLRNNDYFLWSSCSLLKLSIILDDIMPHMVHKFNPPANIFISCVCMPKILDFLHTTENKCFWIWTDLSLSHSIVLSFKFNRIAVSVFWRMFSNVLAS